MNTSVTKSINASGKKNFFLVFVSLFSFSAIILGQTFLFYVFEWEKMVPSPGLFFIKTPYLLTEHLLACLLLALPTLFLNKKPKYLKILYLFFLGVHGLFLVSNQIFFKLFFNNFHLSVSEGQIDGVSNLIGSFLAEFSALSILNVILLCLLLAWQTRLIFANENDREIRSTPISNKVQKQVFAAGTIWVLLSYYLGLNTDNFELNHHPLTSLTLSYFKPDPELERKVQKNLDYYTPRYGNPSIKKEDVQKLSATLNTFRGLSSESKPNIIFIILESVGSHGLLPNGDFDPKITPNLSKLAQHSVLFDSLYTYFPTTSRSHIPMLTGGITITWGSVYREFNFKLNTPNLIDTLYENGYQNAFFSSGNLDYENRMAFYNNLQFDKIFGFNTMKEREKKKHQQSPWGVSEAYAWSQALTWLDKKRAPSKPFFLKYMTVNTHHPYTYPTDADLPFEGDTRIEKYKNSLFAVDKLIGQIQEDLAKRKLDKNTVIMVTGDHGQAFGKLHPHNLVHKRFIYEENIKTFLMIIDPKRTMPPLRSSRVASVGVVMPTVLDLINSNTKQIPETSLFSKQFKNRIVYFHKSAAPQSWGLRDGQWKFIDHIFKDKTELYDLDTDPTEQINIAKSHPEKLETYRKLVSNWYIHTNNVYREKLENFSDDIYRNITLDDMKTHGPKLTAFGSYHDSQFEEKTDFTPSDRVAVWTKWIPYPKQQKPFYYVWISPTNKRYTAKVKIKQAWSDSYTLIPDIGALAKGVWKLEIQLQGQTLLTDTFEVK